MRLILKAFPLDRSGMPLLRKILAGERSNKSVDALMQHVASLGATYAVLEDPYTDRDYSSDYQNFYAGAFKDYPRETKRLHLFAEDVSHILETDLAEQDKAFSEASYLGFIVVRPIPQGPIGRTVLKFPSLGAGLSVRPAARAEFKTNLIAAELSMKGAPFIQQEARVGACAQAAIWMASLAVQTRHRRTAWHSMADITRLAGTPTDASLSTALPAGSGGLNPMHMIRALRGMGHQPLFDLFRDEDSKPVPGPTAASIVMRYLDSGLPVILTMHCIQHAITAVGYVETTGGALREDQTYDAFVRALVVHDDQRGPYRLMPLTGEDIDALPRDRLLMEDGKVLTVEDLSHMFVPLPPRVFLRADRADTVAGDFLSRQREKLAKTYSELLAETPAAAARLAAFFDLVREDRLIRRTYLTTAARYRHHLAKNNLSDELKVQLLSRTLPHFIWVTELLDADAAQQSEHGPRPILGHIVTNATSSSDPSSDLIMAHLPHVVVHRDPDGQAGAWPESVEFPDMEEDEEAVLISEDAPYLSRIRRF